MRAVKKDRACRWIEGSPADQAENLVNQLVEAGLLA
jgi:hypothetical protein